MQVVIALVGRAGLVGLEGLKLPLFPPGWPSSSVRRPLRCLHVASVESGIFMCLDVPPL